MPSFRHSLAFLTDYRLGYSPQRRYPWRWTTPLALFILVTSATLLACLNIPLSAYEITQGFTYFPNATVAALPMSNMIPSFLHTPTATFSPQTLHVGDIFQLNNSIFSYTIMRAFDAVDNRKPVSSFPYYNNPFSSCDVTNITAKVTRTFGDSPTPFQYYEDTVSAFITCTRPTIFQMSVNWDLPAPTNVGLFNVPMNVLENIGLDLQVAFCSEVLDDDNHPLGTGSVEVTVRPCCSCTGNMSTTSDATLDAESANLLEPPCSTEPTRFIGLTGTIKNTTSLTYPWGYIYTWNGSNITDLFAGMRNDRKGYLGSHDLSALNAPFQNLFQAFYHIVRSDLGVILENQIYSSSAMFNRSITRVAAPAELRSIGPFGNMPLWTANTIRAATSNETLMTQWREFIPALNETDRVPVLEYLRPVSRLKPLGSAITSVFVSTFAMVSTVWTIFSIVARALVHTPSDDSDTPILRERSNASFYQAKRSFEEIEATEACFLTGVSKNPIYTDDRLNILFEQVATVMKRIDRMENSLRHMERGIVNELGKDDNEG
ncbi:hypothetical protein B0H14DRAFT_2793072 [Mycena olivaceomarginata]|nr:hypothetical protein B0H14DRAFT_2793072 [Mycena olivaceomarginata]